MLLGLVPAAFLAVFFVVPLLTILARGLSAGSLDVLRDADAWQVVGYTAAQAIASTLLTLLAGMPMAYVLHRYEFGGRRVLLALVTVPFVLPTVVVGLAFRVLLPTGLVGTTWAVLLAHVFFNVAVVVRVVGGLWAHIDPRYEQVSRALGASPWQTWRAVTWPLLRPAVAAASALVLLFTFTSFGVVLVVGSASQPTIEVEIYVRAAQLLDLSTAAALAVLQLVAVVAVLVVSSRLQRRLAVRQPLLPDREVRVRPQRFGQRLLLALVVAEAALLVLPLLALLRASLSVRDGWGLDWWAALLDPPETTTAVVDVTGSVRTSISYAVVATVVAVVVGGLASCAVAYARRGGGTLDAALMLPLGTSAVTVGLGLLLAFDEPPLDLRGVWLTVPLAHALVAVPLVIRTVLPVLRSIDPRLRSAAATLGAAPLRTWATVDLPILGRALVVGAGFAAAVSLGEFGATAFLARADAPTLPVAVVRLLSRPGEANLGRACALAVVLCVLTAVVVGLTERLRVDRPGSL